MSTPTLLDDPAAWAQAAGLAPGQAPCLAYLLDTPERPGEVVTYRCTRPAGHATDHHDTGQGRQWTAADDGVTWADGAVYPVHPDAWPWTDTAHPGPDQPGPPAAASPLPALPATPTPVDTPEATDEEGTPWARLRSEARASRAGSHRTQTS